MVALQPDLWSNNSGLPSYYNKGEGASYLSLLNFIYELENDTGLKL